MITVNKQFLYMHKFKCIHIKKMCSCTPLMECAKVSVNEWMNTRLIMTFGDVWGKQMSQRQRVKSKKKIQKGLHFVWPHSSNKHGTNVNIKHAHARTRTHRDKVKSHGSACSVKRHHQHICGRELFSKLKSTFYWWIASEGFSSGLL